MTGDELNQQVADLREAAAAVVRAEAEARDANARASDAKRRLQYVLQQITDEEVRFGYF
jgi:hypothetical protein